MQFPKYDCSKPVLMLDHHRPWKILIYPTKVTLRFPVKHERRSRENPLLFESNTLSMRIAVQVAVRSSAQAPSNTKMTVISSFAYLRGFEGEVPTRFLLYCSINHLLFDLLMVSFFFFVTRGNLHESLR